MIWDAEHSLNAVRDFQGKGWRNRGQRCSGGMDDLHCPPGGDGAADDKQKQRENGTRWSWKSNKHRCL